MKTPTAVAMKTAHAIAEAVSQEMMDIEHAPDTTLAEYIDRGVGIPEIMESLKAISMLGGNLSDEVLESVGGWREGKDRALKYTEARRIAREALAKLDKNPRAVDSAQG